MDADRWRRIESLYVAAQALTPEERAAFLAESCEGDDPLRLDVELLLSTPALAGDESVTRMPTAAHLAPPSVTGAAPFGLPGSTAGRFVIHERLGIGGMGEVYRAEDTQLKRTVAIKRLVHHPDDERSDTRLLKEAQRASALNHPCIASVYDVFTMGHELLLVMEYVDGITLRERMKRPISVSEFCAIALQCTNALSTAHENGILHGDLKPANIMLTRDGDVKVCDFGLARRLPKDDSAVETTTTQLGIVGTPAYMSPEAVLGERLDARADLFSLGVVFYQMLAARNPFTADGVIATVERVLNISPEPLHHVNPHVPVSLSRAIHRMLEKDRGKRYANADAVGDVLSSIQAQDSQSQARRRRVRGAWTVAALAGVVAVAVLTVPRLAPPPSVALTVPLPQAINLAVLPFTATGAAADRKSFTEGLTESLNEQLAKLTVNHKFQVVTEADRRLRRVTTPLEARDQFGANLALRGWLEYSGQIVKVSTMLLDTRSSQQLRSETFTASVSDAPAVRTGVVEAAVRMMGIELDPSERMLLNVQPDAYAFYLQARGYLLNYDRIESVESAIAVFRSALKIEPKYALAYAGLGEAYWRKHELTSSAAWTGPARGNCEVARDIDSNLAEAHACLGMVLNGTGEYERAATEYSLAVKRDPTNDLAFIGLAAAYDKLGKRAEAEETYLQAIKLRRHYWGGYNNLGAYYYRLGRYKDALDMFKRVTELAPDSFRGHSSAGAVYFQLDQIDEAIKAFKKSLSIRPDFAAASNLGTVYYFEGQLPEAAALFRQARDLDPRSYLVWGNLAQTLELIGERTEAARTETAAAFRQARDLALEQLEVNPRNAAVHLEIADYDAALGDPAGSKRELSEALKLAPDDAQTLFRIAVFHETRLKNRDEALKWLEKAVKRGQAWREIDRAPELRDLRKDPRFKQLRSSV